MQCVRQTDDGLRQRRPCCATRYATHAQRCIVKRIGAETCGGMHHGVFSRPFSHRYAQQSVLGGRLMVSTRLAEPPRASFAAAAANGVTSTQPAAGKTLKPAAAGGPGPQAVKLPSGSTPASAAILDQWCRSTRRACTTIRRPGQPSCPKHNVHLCRWWTQGTSRPSAIRLIHAWSR